MDVKAQDIIQIIQQYFYENNLMDSLTALENESKVEFTSRSNKVQEKINSNSNQELINSNSNQELRILKFIKVGDYKSTLKELQYFGNLKSKYLIDLYEQIITEWIGEGYKQAARELLRKSDPMDLLRITNPDRYIQLEALLAKSTVEKAILLEGIESKRRKIAKDLKTHLQLIPPSRLLCIINQSIKWQISEKIIDPDEPYDLLHDQIPRMQYGDDEPIQTLYKSIKFPKKSHAEVVCFSPDGKYLCIGTFDGFLEIYNYLTAKIRKDLKYQAEENMMVMESACLCLSFDSTSSLLSSGSQNGSIYIWKILTGEISKTISNAHLQGVSSICFNLEGTQVLSASFDHTVKIHGLKSTKALKVFRGHSSFVNTAVYSKDESAVISGSSDGTVKIWNCATTDCISTLSLVEGEILPKSVNLRSVHSIIPLKSPDNFLISNNSHFLYIVNSRGKLVRSLELKDCEAIGVSLSPNNDYVYVITEKELLCLYLETNEIIHKFKCAQNGEIIGIEHHPFSNLLTIYDDNGEISIYKN